MFLDIVFKDVTNSEQIIAIFIFLCLGSSQELRSACFCNLSAEISYLFKRGKDRDLAT